MEPISEPRDDRLRILVVEDSYLTGRVMARDLESLGATVIGPAPSVAAAMRLLDAGGCTAAVLDINLGPETSEAVAWRLEREAIPFFFVSGYASPKTMLQHYGFRARPLLVKPVDLALLAETMGTEFGPGAAPLPHSA